MRAARARPLIALDEEAISVKAGNRPSASICRIPWSTVASVVAFKRDCVTVDLICLAIQSDSGIALELNEEMPGWSALVIAIPEKLPGCPKFEEWFESVAFPGFGTNSRILFQKSGNPVNTT